MLKDFFYLQRNDRQAIIVIISIIILAMTLVIVIGNSYQEPEQNAALHSDTTHVRKRGTKERPIYYKVDEAIHELFPFDPNTADSTQLLKLGLSPWQVRNIYHYRAKGGIYRNPKDFARLFGLTKKQFETLEPYIQISDDYKPASDFYGNEYHQEKHSEYAPKETEQEKPVYNYPHKLKLGQHIAINSADTTELQRIPGIGKSYAKAITRYREELGGFASAQQLLEIEGIPESALQFITVDANVIKKMDINHLSLNQLRHHPYINFYQAKAICDYRRLRGPLKSLQELKLLKDFPPAEIERLQPYISF